MITIHNLRFEKMQRAFDVRVDRESVLGNPYPLKCESDRYHVIGQYAGWLEAQLKKRGSPQQLELARLHELHVRYNILRLFCWCAPLYCHAELIKARLEKMYEAHHSG